MQNHNNNEEKAVLETVKLLAEFMIARDTNAMNKIWLWFKKYDGLKKAKRVYIC